MESPNPHPSEDESSSPTLSMPSGTGAPIFEAGPHTRIRRNPMRAIATLSWEGGPREVFGQIRNISLTGCLLRTEATIPVDTELSLTITLLGNGDETDYDVSATVRRTTTIDGRRGYGLEFNVERREHRRSVQILYAESANG